MLWRCRASGQPPVAGAFAGLGAAGRDGGLAGDCRPGSGCLLGPGPAFAVAGLVVHGVRPAQEARCAPVGNLVMSAPVSARVSCAARRRQPGIDSACWSCSSYGASSRSITVVSWSMSA